MDEEDEAGGAVASTSACSVVSADEVDLYSAPGASTMLRDVEWNNTVEMGEEHSLPTLRGL